MKATAHAAIGLGTALLLHAPPELAAVCVLGALLPDCDSPAGPLRLFGPPGRALAAFLQWTTCPASHRDPRAHRGFLHTLWFALLLGAGASLLLSPPFGLAIFLGALSHLLGDCLWPPGVGVMLLFPISHMRFRILPKWTTSLLPQRRHPPKRQVFW